MKSYTVAPLYSTAACKIYLLFDTLSTLIRFLVFLIASIIAYESPSNIVAQSFRSAIPLCCISSHHGQCSYYWRKLGEPSVVLPHTPVLFVKSVGLYQCTVACEEGDEDSHVIAVFNCCFTFKRFWRPSLLSLPMTPSVKKTESL